MDEFSEVYNNRNIYRPENAEGREYCTHNAIRLMEHMVENGVDKSELSLVTIWSFNEEYKNLEIINPTYDLVRAEDKDSMWRYHAFVMKNGQVFDLSADQSLWGVNLNEYITKFFEFEINEKHALEPWSKTPLYVNSYSYEDRERAEYNTSEKTSLREFLENHDEKI